MDDFFITFLQIDYFYAKKQSEGKIK